jgi:MerR family mercuric resistance operon transcriptional regulator
MRREVMADTRTSSSCEVLGIGVLGKRTGVSPETIRYYEREGLLPEAGRSEGGHRRYSEDHLKRLTFIVHSRELGFSQPEVRELLALAADGGRRCDEVRDVASQHLGEVRTKLGALRRMESVLEGLVGACASGQREAHCPLLDALFEPLD